MVVAQNRDRAETIVRDRLERLAPRRFEGGTVDVESNRRAIPVGEQPHFLDPLIEPVRPQARHRAMPVEMNEHVGGELVELTLAVGILIEELAQAPVAEIA